MNRSVRLCFRCCCGTYATETVSTAAVVWACPSCAQRWRPDADSVSTVLSGVARLRALRRDMAILIGMVVLVSAALGFMHPPWLLTVPVLVGGAGFLAGPSYRKRVQLGRDAANTPIELVPT